MGDAYRIDELRFPQEFTQDSAAGGTSIDTTGFVVPANTVRTILYASLAVDVGEARYAVWQVLGPGSHAIRGPFAYDTNNGNPVALLEQGNEIRLLPGNRMRLDRNVATAGSIMTFKCRYIDHIIPFQTHVDPYDPARRRSSYLSNPRGGGTASGGGGTAGGGSDAGTGFGGSGPEGEPLI